MIGVLRTIHNKAVIIFALLICNIISMAQVQPNTMRAASGSPNQYGGITGRVWSPDSRPLYGAVIYITDEHLTVLHNEAVSFGTKGEFRLSFLPVNQKLRIFVYHSGVPNSIYGSEIILNPGESKELAIFLPMPGGIGVPTNLPEVILRGQNIRSSQDLIKHLEGLSYPGTKPVTNYTSNSFLKSAWYDIGLYSFIDDQTGNELEMYAISGLGNANHFFNRTFRNNGSLKEFTIRKKIYKEVLVEIAFQTELQGLNAVDLFMDSPQGISLEQSIQIIETLGITGKIGIATAEFLSSENMLLLEYVKDKNAYTRLLNDLKQAGRSVRHGGLNNFHRLLEGVSIATNSIQVIKSGWIITNSALLLDGLQFDLGRMRLLEISHRITINDRAFNEALDELISEFNQPPDDLWEKLLFSIEQHKDEVNEGLISLGEIAKGAGYLSGSLSGPAALWIGAILFGIRTYTDIQEWESDLMCAAASATIYGHLYTSKTNEPGWREACVIEYSEIEFYKRMKKLFENGYMWVLEVIRPSRKEIHTYLDDEYSGLLKNIAKKRLSRLKVLPKGKPGTTSLSITLGFIIDSSSSMKNSDPSNIRKSAIIQIIERLSGDENIFLVDFDHNAKWTTSDIWDNWGAEDLKNRVRSIDSNGSTNIGMGLQAMNDALEGTINDYSKTAVVLLSDGMGNYENQVDWFAQNGIKIYTVSYKDQADAKLLNEIAGATGGIYLQANDENEVVAAFMQFFDDLQGNSKYISYSGSFEGKNECSIPSFYVDPSSTTLIGNMSWSGQPKTITIVSPSGKTYSESQTSSIYPTGINEKFFLAELSQGPNPGLTPLLFDFPNSETIWTTGKNFLMVKIPDPEPGQWSVTAKTANNSPSNDPFIFEASGSSGLAIKMNKGTGGMGYRYTFENDNEPLDWNSSHANIKLSTPSNKSIDISSNYKNASFYFYPNDGLGNYNTKVTLTVKDKMGNTLQRHFSRSILVGEIVPGYLAPVTEILGGYIRTEQSSITGNRPGILCTIYLQGTSKDQAKAIGRVTDVNSRECTIKITEYLTADKVVLGDVVELDLAQWQNDY